MAEYKIVIPVDGSGNYDSGGTDTDFIVDRGVSRSPKFRILSAKFGDGYEQRLRDGINSKEEDISLSFNNRTPTEIYAIADYLDATIPTSFTFYVDDDSFKVTCEDYQITHTETNAYSLSTKFKRVYEA
jgi:phage-related protein